MFANSEDVDYYTNFFYQSKNVFNWFGLWYPGAYQWWKKPLIVLRRVILFVFFGFFVLLSTYSGVPLYAKLHDSDRVADTLSYSTAILTFEIKGLFIMIKEKPVKELTIQLENWAYEYRHYKNAIKNIRKALKSYKIIFWIGEFAYAFTIFTYCFYPVLSGAGRIIPMEPTITYGIDVHKVPNYEIIMVYQFISIVCNTIVCMAFDMMFCGMMAITAATFQNFIQGLKEDLEQIPDKISKKEEWKLKEEKFAKRVEEYNEIMKYIEKLEDVYMISSLMNFYYNYIVMGICMYQVSKLPFPSVRFFSMFFGVVSVCVQLIAYCHFGQEIVNRNQEFWDYLCTIKWYNQSLNFRKMVILSLARTQNDRYISAGKIMTLSRETMKKTLQGIFTYYMFLTNFSN